jgi:hypothetical protein
MKYSMPAGYFLEIRIEKGEWHVVLGSDLNGKEWPQRITFPSEAQAQIFCWGMQRGAYWHLMEA